MSYRPRTGARYSFPTSSSELPLRTYIRLVDTLNKGLALVCGLAHACAKLGGTQ